MRRVWKSCLFSAGEKAFQVKEEQSRSIYGSASGGAARILGGGKGMTKIRIGTRGSKLALVQTTLVAEALRACWPGVETETVIIKPGEIRFLTNRWVKLVIKGIVCF